MRKYLAIMICLLILGSLTAKVPEIKNENVKVEKIPVQLKKSVDLTEELDAFQEYVLIGDNIYLCSLQSKMVWIIDFDGNIVKVLDTVGSGPGEFSMPTRVFDDSKYDRFGVVDQMNRRTSYFDYKGNYIEDVGFEGLIIPFSRHYVNDMILNFTMNVELDQEKGSIMMKPTISLIGEETLTLFQNSFNPIEMNIGSSRIPIYDYNNDHIYITTIAPDEYLIHVYDYTGSHIMDISKKYKKVKRTDEEIEEIKNQLEEVKKQAGPHGADLEFKDYDYNNAIASLLIDGKNRLWVQTQDEDGSFFDVFDNNGKITGRCYLEDQSLGIFRFHDGLLYEISGDEDDGYTLNIYEVKK
jgi:hypothetical protein